MWNGGEIRVCGENFGRIGKEQRFWKRI